MITDLADFWGYFQSNSRYGAVIVFLIFTSAEEVMYSSASVCVYLCAKYLKKYYERILMEFCGELERSPGCNRLDFGIHSDSCMDPGSFSRILCH